MGIVFRLGFCAWNSIGVLWSDFIIYPQQLLLLLCILKLPVLSADVSYVFLAYITTPAHTRHGRRVALWWARTHRKAGQSHASDLTFGKQAPLTP